MAHEIDNIDEYRQEEYMDRNGFVFCEACGEAGEWESYDCWHGDHGFYWCGNCEADEVYTASIRDEHFETLSHRLIPIDAAEGASCRLWFDRYLVAPII